MSKFFKVSHLVMGLGMLGLFGCHKNSRTEEETSHFALTDKIKSTTQFEVARRQPLLNELKFYGKILPDNNKMIEIYPVVGGSVTHVYVELGDYVKKGELLASIRSTEVAGFEKELDDARNDVVLARNNLKVAQEIFEGKLSTERDVLEAKSQLDKAMSQLHRIEETYKIYNIRGGATFEVRSPLSGFIVQKNINTDMLLRNDKSDNIFDIAEINEVWAIANVNEIDIQQVKLGIHAEVKTLSYPDKIFNGKVDKIFNIIDPDTKAMRVRIKLHNEGYLLKPEMRANIKLSYTEPDTMISVPSKAVIFDKSKNFVMVFHRADSIETRQVNVFREIGTVAFILSGLKEGEKVITHNQLLIFDALND